MPKNKKTRWVRNANCGEAVGPVAPAARAQQAEALPLREQPFRYLAVLDFEATCICDGRIQPQEVIEFPLVLLDTRTAEIVGEFHRYCRPLVHPQLSDFCIELTGIQQAWVDEAEPFAAVFTAALHWLQEKLEAERESGSAQIDTAAVPGFGGDALLCTCGDWDLKTMLPAQCALIGEHVPALCQQWANVKEVFRQHHGRKPGGMVEMLSALGLDLVGRHHSGIDDTRNIARVCVALLQDGALFTATSQGTGKGKNKGKGKGE